ncbi:MAG: hypothetical protein GX099_00880 [Clostridiaceae bacterium]|jgi:hypothetical protein|nr:hypothetical protein [Clostridiaceae bacterium]
MGSFWDKVKGLMNSDSDKPALDITLSEKKGGIVKINCTSNGKYLIRSVASISLFQVAFDTAKKTRTKSIHGLEGDWDRYGPECFYFEVMKVVPRPEGMKDKDYRDLLSAAEREISQREDPALSY